MNRITFNGQNRRLVITNYGALIFGTMTETDKIGIANSLGLSGSRKNYIRLGSVAAKTWVGTPVSQYTQWINAGKLISLNVTWAGGSQGNIQPFATSSELSTWSTNLTGILSDFIAVEPPAVVVVENEETNQNYHSGPITDYINELAVAVTVCHNLGLKVADGGIHTPGVCYWVWKDFLNRGLTTDADNWFNLTFNPQMQYAALHPGANTFFDTYWAEIDTLLNAFTSLNIDYVNMHLYEPTNGMGDGQHVLPGVYGTVANYLRSRTGKKVISNEIGQKNLYASVVPEQLRDMGTSGYEYCLWFDGDGGGAAMALNNQTSPFALRSNGVAFEAFMNPL